MKLLTKLAVALSAIALLAAPVLAQQENPTDPRAPQYKYVSLDLSGIGTTGTSATTTCTNLYIDCRGQKEIALQTKFNASGAGTDNVTYTFSKSLDKNNWQTAGTFTWVLAANGTTDVIGVTNWTVGGVGWIKLDSIANASASRVVTNKSIIYAVKRNSP